MFFCCLFARVREFRGEPFAYVAISNRSHVLLPGNHPTGQLLLQQRDSFNHLANLQCKKQTRAQLNLVSTMRPFSDITANQIIPKALRSGIFLGGGGNVCIFLCVCVCVYLCVYVCAC